MSKASPAARYDTIQAEAMLTASLLVLSCTYGGGWMERDRGERGGGGGLGTPPEGHVLAMGPVHAHTCDLGDFFLSSGLLRPPPVT